MSLVLVVSIAESTRTAQSPQSPQQPVFRGGTTIVEVDAIVRGKDRQFVADLTRDDFEIREDGALQRIETFYLVRGPELALLSAPAPLAQPSLPALPGPPAHTTRRVIVIVFDLEHILPGNLDRARRAAQEFLAKDFRGGDIGGVVSGGTMVKKRLTSVREELEADVKSVQPIGDSRSLQLDLRTWPRFTDALEAYLVDRRDEEVLGRVVGRACYDEPDQCKGGVPVREIVLQKARQHVNEFSAAGMRTLKTLAGLVDGLSRLAGRKTVILLSDGFLTEDMSAEVRQVVALAAPASLRVYSLDTRGLNRGSASSDIIDAPRAGMPGDRLPDINALSDGANSLAVDTGGVAIRNENNLAKALDEIDRDTSSYYVLGYRPVNTELDGKFREITVRVKRTGISVRSRKGYLATRGPAEPEGPVGQVGQAGQEGRVGMDMAATPPPTTDRPVAVAPDAGKPPAAPSPATPAAVPSTPAVPMAPPGAIFPNAARSEKPSVLHLRPDLPAEVAKLTGSEGRPDVAERASPPLPDSLARQAKEGWEAYQRGDVKGARIRLAGVAAHPGARPWMRYVLGWSEYALTEYAAAATEWEQVREAVPEFEPVYFDLVDTYLQQGEYGRAVGVLRAAEKRWRQDVDVYNALGVVQLGRGAIDDAVSTFEKGVAVDPSDATACYNLAKTHEVRYVRSRRLQHATRSAANTLSQDRDLAIEYYRRTIALGGPFVESAKEGLKRLGVQ